jgi:two-component SAPR family response regulator
MGMIKQRQGKYLSAEDCFQKALSLSRGPIHFQHGEAYALVNLGDLYQRLGMYELSLAVIEDGLAIARQLKSSYLTNCTITVLSMTYLLMGDAETAMLLISEVACEKTSYKKGGFERANCELAYGTILLFQGHYAKAQTCLRELESHLQSIGLQWELLHTKLRLIECLLRQGHEAEVTLRVEEVALRLQNSDYIEVVRQELGHLPYLAGAIKTLPALAHFRAMFQPGMEAKEEQEEASPAMNEFTLDQTPSGKAGLKMFAFGEPVVMINEKPITRWRRPRAMELFFLLLDSGRPLRKEQIIAALWPESDERVTQSMHSTIHYLRKSLGASCIVSRSGMYWLDMASLFKGEVWYDVAAFQRYEEEAKAAFAANDDAGAKAKLLAMVDLYTGDYLQSFYSDWCLFRRDKLRIAYLDARQQLALIAWREEQFDESATHWQHILVIDNCFEDAHYGLMRYYMRRGKRGLALRQYRHCADVLQRELAVEPGAAIQKLGQLLIKAPDSR